MLAHEIDTRVEQNTSFAIENECSLCEPLPLWMLNWHVTMLLR